MLADRVTVGRAVVAALLVLIVVQFLSANTGKDRICACSRGSSDKSSSRLPRDPNNRTTRLPSICWSETCRPDFVKYFQAQDACRIPEIRHILWKNETVTQYFADQLTTWQRIHPNWTFVLWRDQDLVPFVAAHFPGLLAKFKSLPGHIMRVDMIRYMLLYKYGGTYADLDYTLAKSLDPFRRLPAVVTLEPEAHSLEFYGLQWPVKRLASPAFLMSTPGHAFYHFVLQRLESKAPSSVLYFAGPFGLTEIMNNYLSLFPVGTHANDMVFVPPSYSFYSYKDNRFNTSGSKYVPKSIQALRARCKRLMSSNETGQQRPQKLHQLVQFCTDVNNMDPITDKSQPVYAVHDLQKLGAVYDGAGTSFFSDNSRDMRRVLKNLKLGHELI